MKDQESGIATGPAEHETEHPVQPQTEHEAQQAAKEHAKKGRAQRYLDEIKKLKQENEHIQDKLLRKIAEFDNYKKRTERDFFERIQNANENLIIQLLPVVDDLERLLNHSAQAAEENSLYVAVDLIYKKLVATLEKTGLKALVSVGEDFDPEKHDALLQQESDQYSSGKIIEEHVKGFELNRKIIRHAQVIVAK
jgi:molecular chaperone GrpE